MRKKLLFISGSIGLGHVGRDIEIAREVRARRPHTDIVWIADEPARSVLRAAGENVAPESTKVSFGTERVERSSRDLRANMTMIGVDMMQDADANAAACREVIRREEVDLVIGDETFDLLDAISRDRPMLRGRRMVLITDFLGFEPVSENPLERTYARYANAVWYRMMKDRDIVAKCLLSASPGMCPDDGAPACRRSGLKVDHVGYVLPFKPKTSDGEVRTSLGYEEEL